MEPVLPPAAARSVLGQLSMLPFSSAEPPLQISLIGIASGSVSPADTAPLLCAPSIVSGCSLRI